ncbi:MULTISPECIES: DUF7674 family protein [Kamptonema]|uniref:DUF7674 family protein n=1 Tax=Kamptonema TaxID=1501433 RepID=UPI0001DAC216|nr:MULTISPECIES: hypothetical protein [Kamptonema]CBN54228.1 conserved hypothetical protein [Kamptonema sp. PCC 6506]
MSELKFENIGEKLVEVVPELRQSYELELKWWGNEQPGPHIIFGDLLNPYLISLLESHNQPILKQIFTFLEQLANHEDIKVQEVVAVTVCERLGDNPEWLSKVRQYMGKTTLQFSQEIEAFWGREQPITA